ncbi:hypothetical protein, partial [Serratia marcescens]|uniref:hypothetical protein n=1 Tax=Serratia marcescens TaxID=615 RepID=UPI0011F1DE25
MAKRKLVTAGKYTPAHLTDNEEFALLELEEKLKERKARKTQLSMYLPSVLDKVKAALIISMPMEEIKEKYGVPIRVIMTLQKKYNPKLRGIGRTAALINTRKAWRRRQAQHT